MEARKDKILEIVKKWKINKIPEYREFRCAKCQKTIKKAWHIWLKEEGFNTEVHFCKDCFKENGNKK